MGQIIKPSDEFWRMAKAVRNDRQIHDMRQAHGYVFIAVSGRSGVKPNETLAVPMYKFPDLALQSGDYVRVALSGDIISPGAGQQPCAVVSEIEKLGEIVIAPIVQVVYKEGHSHHGGHHI